MEGWNSYEQSVAVSMIWCEKDRPDDCPAGIYRAQGASVGGNNLGQVCSNPTNVVTQSSQSTFRMRHRFDETTDTTF